jgi:uroporphyrinogen-III decarboxylase
MNSKERIQRTLARQTVDRIPIGFFCIDFDTAGQILGHETYLRAKAKSQIAFWEGRRDEVVQSWKEDMIALYKKLDFIDIINVAAMASGIVPPKDYVPEKVRKVDDSTWEAADGRVWKYSPVTADLTLAYDPTAHFSLEQFDLEAAPKEPDPSIFEVVDAVIAAFPDRYILGPSGGEAGMVLLGDMEQGLRLYAEDPELVQRAIDYATRMANLQDEWYIRPGTDAAFWGQDFAATTGPLMSPRMFRQFCLPSIQERVRAVKRRGLRAWKHACGNNWKLLDMFVEAGYDVYQSIQHSASMDIGQVKAKYGDRLVLWGGVMVEHLVSGTPEDIYRDAEYAMRVAAPGGGYIFGDTHSIAVGTKYDNFMALIDAYHKLAYQAAR